MVQYITWATYGIFVVLLLLGGSFKFRKGEYHEDCANVEVMKSLKGIAALGVILHHVSQHTYFQNSGTIGLFVNAGYIFVAIFFFCSGYGLIKSLDKKPDYLKGFVKNRIGKGIVLPFYVNILVYGLIYFIFGIKLPVAQWVCSVLGLTMMNVYAWFPIVLFWLYLSFFVIFKFVKNRKVALSLMLVCILAQGIIFCVNGHFAWWYGEPNWWTDWAYQNDIWWREQKVLWFSGEWWVNSSIALLVGMIVADKETAIKKFFSKLYYLKLVIALILMFVSYVISQILMGKFGYWTEWSGNGPDIMNKFVTYLGQIPFVIIFSLVIYIVLMKYHSINPITKFFGKFSLHTYLMNLMALDIMQQFLNDNRKLTKYFLLIYLVGALVLSIILGVAEQYLTDGIAKLIFRKKKEVKKA